MWLQRVHISTQLGPRGYDVAHNKRTTVTPSFSEIAKVPNFIPFDSQRAVQAVLRNGYEAKRDSVCSHLMFRP